MNIKDNCWLYAGKTIKGGYGIIFKDYKHYLVHRLMYENFIGEIPEGLEINHICEVPLCINPEHLEAVTHKQNMWYSRSYGDNLCKRGHEFTKDNTMIRVDNTGTSHRRCRKCFNLTARNRYWNKKAIKGGV